MIVIGLTGSIAMGKTTLAKQCKMLGARICDSDAIVHRLFAKDGAAVAPLGAVFPAAIEKGTVNRARLSQIVFNAPEKLRTLEKIVHPLVQEAQQHFLAKARRERVKIVVLDIPLLFETGAENRCDYVIVASAPEFLQTLRALRRPHVTHEKLARIKARQLSDTQKRKRADWVVLTGLGKRHSLNSLKAIFSAL